jgi:NAD(P)H-dependent FMN reductase
VESDALKVALIVGSTRPNRFADVPARWIADAAAARDDLSLEVLDLRDWPLPFYSEPKTASVTGGVFSDPVAERWRHKIGEFDGFIATAAEYNHGPTAVLKNAFDSAAFEWNQKPISYVGYGGVGGARAVEQLRMVAVELRMAPIKHAVHIGMEPFVGLLFHGKTLDDYDHLIKARTAMFDELVWWGKALRSAREATAEVDSIAA